MRVLAVDDDPFILELLPVLFKQSDLAQVSVASSGADALAILGDPDQRFDCLLLDIEMPQMDGVELCTRIRAIAAYRDAPIIMLTAKTDKTSIERAFAAGANDYISKPFDIKELVTRVHVAEKLLQSMRNVATLDPLDAADAMLEGGQDCVAGQHRFALNDAVQIAHVPQLVLSFSLGNYLSQLSRRSLDDCQIFATRLDDVETHFENSTTQDFAVTLAAVAEAIADTINTPNMLMAYEGNGTFLCITTTESLPEWPAIEDQIQAAITDFCDQTARSLSVSVGNPVPPNASKTQRVRRTFDRAIGRVTMRQQSKRPHHTPLARK